MSDGVTRAAFFAGYALALAHFLLWALLCRRRDGRRPPLRLALLRALPARPVILFLVFLGAGVFALRGQPERFAAALADGVSFALMAAVLDLVLLVLVKHPLSFSAREYYKERGLFVALCAVATAAAPVAAACLPGV